VKISDMGLAKKLDHNQSSFYTGADSGGSTGWRAPELLVEVTDASSTALESHKSVSAPVLSTPGPRRLSKKIDIFALGCIFYYVLCNGAHPFGGRYEREANILRGQYNLDALKHSPEVRLVVTLKKRRADESIVLIS